MDQRYRDKNPTKMIPVLLTVVFLWAAFLCPAASHAETRAQKDPAPISVSAVYLTPADRTCQLDVQTNYPDLPLTYYTQEGETALTVDQNGTVTMLTDRPGTYVVYVYSPETSLTEACTLPCPIVVSMVDQEIIGPSRVTGVFGRTVKLKVSAKTEVTWRSDSKSIARVDASGNVTFLRPGTAIIVAIAEHDDFYRTNSHVIRVTSKMGKPSVRASAGKRKVRLSWTRVPKTQEYLIYCKYPGSKKYRLVARKLGSVKGVTHGNLKKGKKYSYKIRAYLKLKGKKYYGPYSKAVTVKAK